MANAITGNKIYISAVGSLTDKRTLVSHILFTANAANDTLILKESADGEICLAISAATAHQTQHYDLSAVPMLFNNGIYVSSLSASATATLITTSAGS